ncbi:hypothetical protein [Pseudobacteriovorax antillogorgiicola]|nr:hypothetical protein [Pseudobacteriovorax antillogorgiicola]
MFQRRSFFPSDKKIPGKDTERSFTIIETLAALAILLPVVIETVSTQGSIINNNLYMRRMTEATWLAKRIMSQVEYNYQVYEFKDIDGDYEGEFKLDPEESEFDYTFKVSIQEWKLPLFDLLLQGGPKNPEEETDVTAPSEPSGGALAGIPGIQQVIDSLFDGHILKIANVEVFWPEGARRDSINLTMLLTNQKALDAYVVSKKKVMKQMLDDVENSIDPPPKNNNNNNSNNNNSNNNSGNNNSGSQGSTNSE